MFSVMSAYICLTARCYTTLHLHQVCFLFRWDFRAFFAHILYFKFLEFKEFNKTLLFYSCLLDMRLVIANSALCALLAIYHLISNARSWNNC